MIRGVGYLAILKKIEKKKRKKYRMKKKHYTLRPEKMFDMDFRWQT